MGKRQRAKSLSMENRDKKKTGRPVQVVQALPNHTFELDEEALAEVLLQEDVKDLNVIVVSVTGAFRKGKTFLLNFLLRYMNSKYIRKEDTDNWLGSESDPLSGFSWRGGSERHTTGILMWSKVFPVTLSNGEKVAVVLMDTQGAFDSQSTVRDSATIFALSTMLSSVQIYNLMQNIQEDDLQHLELFTEYGRLALEKSGSTPFQRLQFLVRDWCFPYEAAYGVEGGIQTLNKRLEISDLQHPDLQSLRKRIKSCFSDVSCFLMPHPGKKVATNPKFDGKLSEIEVDFKEQLKIFVPMLLAPENLVMKKINGQMVKTKELLEYFKCYMDIFAGDELPEPKSMFFATAEANNLSAVEEAKDLYQHMMERVCEEKGPDMPSASLKSEHQRCSDEAYHQFENKRKMGNDELSQTYMEKLHNEIEEVFQQFKKRNESRKLISARTRTAICVVAVVAVQIYCIKCWLFANPL